MNTHDVGDEVRISCEFRDGAGVLADPTSVTLKVKSPAGVVSTYTLAAGTVTRDSAGAYHRDVIPDAPGVWQYRWFGTPPIQLEEPGRFLVRRPNL